jgi:hypothetical protein
MVASSCRIKSPVSRTRSEKQTADSRNRQRAARRTGGHRACQEHEVWRTYVLYARESDGPVFSEWRMQRKGLHTGAETAVRGWER